MKKPATVETAASMAARQRDISVSEFFLKNRHLLGFDNPRRALLTTVKEAVDNALDACEEAGILPEVAVDIQELGENRFRVSITDNGPGIVRNQIPKIFAKLLYGSKFHRLRMSRGQQGIGISAAGMYGQLTTGSATRIDSRVEGKAAHHIDVQIDTRKNTPAILKDHETEWRPLFPNAPEGGETKSLHGTCVSIDMEAAYVRGRLSVDEYLKQCAIVNPHLRLHYRVRLRPKEVPPDAPPPEPAEWTTFARATELLPPAPHEIKPHPHGVELGLLMQMLKTSAARSVKTALATDFSRVSPPTAEAICRQAGLDPMAKPGQIAHHESEALYKALNAAKLMRPQMDCLSPIGEELMLAGLKKEVPGAFYAAVSRPPSVYRGNPFQIEAALAYLEKPSEGTAEGVGNEEPVQVLRFANRVPLLHMAGGCAITKAALSVNWKAYGLPQPKGSLPLGPVVLMVHVASVWVPFTSESKDAVAHYPELIREIVFALQELGRQLGVHLGRRHREDELARKRKYMELYIPHLALGLRQILDLPETEEEKLRGRLRDMLEHARSDR